MSYWKDKTFTAIYRKIQKQAQRHPEQAIDVLQQAKREYYQTQDSVKLVSGKEYTPTSSNLGKEITPEKVEEDKPPVDIEDPIIRVAGTSMYQSKWEKVKQAYKGGSAEEKHRICVENIRLKEYKMLKQEFEDGDEDA